jgi:hypothetical protein
MSIKKDWVPGPDDEFDALLKKYCQMVVANTSGADPVWPRIPAARVTELQNCYADWYLVFSKLKSAHTSGDVVAKQEQRDVCEEVLRDFNRSYILNAREVTDAQRRDIGCHVHSRHRTPVPAPEALPEADIVYPGKHLLQLVNIRAVPGTMSDGEAEAEFGVRIFWGVMGPPTEGDRFRLSAPPASGNDLPHSTFTHRKKYRFDFDGDSGKTVYFCLRYENEKGGKKGEGSFGPVLMAVIP